MYRFLFLPPPGSCSIPLNSLQRCSSCAPPVPTQLFWVHQHLPGRQGRQAARAGSAILTPPPQEGIIVAANAGIQLPGKDRGWLWSQGRRGGQSSTANGNSNNRLWEIAPPVWLSAMLNW